MSDGESVSRKKYVGVGMNDLFYFKCLRVPFVSKRNTQNSLKLLKQRPLFWFAICVYWRK